MTDQNNAAQPGLTDAIRDAIRKAYDDGYNDAKMDPEGTSTYCGQAATKHGTAALLSKLRAPVAGEATDREIGALWASTPSPGRVVAFARALLAQYAAPQASEAVRSERLERANKLPEVECPRCELKVISSCGSKGCPTNDGYADLCQTQADKDGGGCAKGAGDMVTPEMLRAAQMKSELGAIACADYSGGYGLIEDLYRVMRRAALSPTPSVVKQSLTATQTGEKGEKDAG